MMLIADSGSTKTDWAWIENGTIVHRATTAGINPVHQTEEDIEKVVTQLFPRKEDGVRTKEITINYKLSSINFYGAGCIPEKKGVVEKVLRKVFPEAEKIEVENDLLGAARAVCQYQEGLACILGTGSNSCYYDGAKIVENVPPLGYILGDEGSGAVLGKLFLNALFKGTLPVSMKEDFLQKSGLSYPEIIQRVYRQPMANRFLASTSLYIKDHIDNPLLCDLVVQNFRQFFRSNIVPYQRPELPVHFVGSMAFIYRDQLVQAAEAEGFHVGHTLQSPMEGLVMYHEKGIDATY